MLRRTYPHGYIYFYVHKQVYGWRQIGPEGRMVVDDFGSLVFAGDEFGAPDFGLTFYDLEAA